MPSVVHCFMVGRRTWDKAAHGEKGSKRNECSRQCLTYPGRVSIIKLESLQTGTTVPNLISSLVRSKIPLIASIKVPCPEEDVFLAAVATDISLP